MDVTPEHQSGIDEGALSEPIADVATNRATRKWNRRELAGRVVWAIARLPFALSVRPMWRWRRCLLRLFGARIGRDVHIYPTVRVAIPWNLTIGDYSALGDRVTIYALGRISIGARVTVSQGAHLCAGTHDYRDPAMPLVKAPITIGDDAWICADAFIGPGTAIGKRAIVGARAVAMKDVSDDAIVVGNPGREIRKRPRPSKGRAN